MKIFYLEFFINEIFSVEKFPNYGMHTYTHTHIARNILSNI